MSKKIRLHILGAGHWTVMDAGCEYSRLTLASVVITASTRMAQMYLASSNFFSVLHLGTKMNWSPFGIKTLKFKVNNMLRVPFIVFVSAIFSICIDGFAPNFRLRCILGHRLTGSKGKVTTPLNILKQVTGLRAWLCSCFWHAKSVLRSH